MPEAPDPVGSRTLPGLLDAGPADAVLFRRPDAPPVTYGAFRAMRDRIAGGLAERGVGPGDVVAIHLPTGVEMVATLFAVHHRGGVAAMSDPANTDRELDGIRRRTGAALTVTDTAELPAEPVGPVRIGPDTPATILFTSGTTAEPKAVRYRHGHHVFGADVYATALRLAPDSLLMHHFPLFHMNGLNQLGAALSVGAEVLLVDRFRSGRFDDLLDEFAPTATFLNGTHIKMIRAAGTAPSRPSPLRRVGMALQMADHDYEWFESRYGAILTEGYGQTESITLCLTNPVVGARRGTCGLPVPGYEVRLGADDELQLRSSCRYAVMDGYLDDPAATDAAFDDGWLRTGDVVAIDDAGFVRYVDRLKDIIKRAGENISAREVEAALERHPAVREAAVVGRPDALREEVPVAFVVTETDTDPDTLRAHCVAELARHKIPEEFLVVDALPRTAVGKIEKKALRRSLGDG